MRSNLACVLVTMLLTTACASDPAEPRTDDAFPAAAARDLQQTLDAVVAAGVAPGVSLIVDHPVHHRFAGAAGVADRETGAALTPDRRFRAGSMLKTAVATAVLQLVEHNQLSLDAKLADLLPVAITAQVAEASSITLRMLLDHTSGIPEFSNDAHEAALFANPRHVWTLDELLAFSAAEPRTFAPGAGWAYSNTDYVLLGEVLAATTGTPWRELVEDRVFRRAGLHHSELPAPGNVACTRCARGYEEGEAGFVDATEIDPSMAAASGGHALITTPADLATFLDALETGALFDRDTTLATMHQFVSAPNPAEATAGYGLGLTQFEVNGVELVGHLGGTAGYQGFMMRDTAHGVVVSGYMTQRGDLGAFILPVLDAVSRIP